MPIEHTELKDPKKVALAHLPGNEQSVLLKRLKRRGRNLALDVFLT